MRRPIELVPRPLRQVVQAPTWPSTVPKPAEKTGIGTDYDTSWARTPVARFARAVVLDDLTVPLTHLLARPRLVGAERLDPLGGPCLFVANHTSHLDTMVVLAALPPRFRHRCVVAAASDTFFDRRWKSALWSLSIAAIPMERAKVGRASADLAASLLEDRWSVVIYPEGGRSPDGWGQEFHGGAAYLAKRTGAPVVPVHLQGVRPILAKGADRLRPGSVTVRIGAPLRFEGGGEDARRFAARIERAVSELADEAETDWWSARRRAAGGSTPSLRGPVEASPWRRAWELPESRQSGRVRAAGDRLRDEAGELPWQRRAGR